MGIVNHTHRELCDLSVRWLRRAHSAGGPGCVVAVSECRNGHAGETPDAIGFRPAGAYLSGTWVLECKTSRADFLADSAKPHRQPDRGMGNYRAYVAPAGLIEIDDLPPGWGLLEVNARGHIKARAGAPLALRGPNTRLSESLRPWHLPSDRDGELGLLTRLFQRVGDAEASSRLLRDLCTHRDQLLQRVEDLKQELRTLRRSNVVLESSFHA